MTDFTSFDASSHPIVKLEDDWNNLLAHGLVKASKFIVRVNGSYYECIKGDGTTAGTIVYGGADNAGSTDGTDPDAVLQAAVDNLTSGRTYYEKVTVHGSYSLSTAWTIPSYTILDLYQAVLTIDANANCNIIENNDSAGGNTNIMVLGGILDGNKANQTTPGTDDLRGILINNTDDVIIKDLYVHDAYVHGIEIKDGSRIWIDKCRSDDNGSVGGSDGYGFVADRSTGTRRYIYWSNCFAENNYGHGYHWKHDTKYCMAVNCHAEDNNEVGFLVGQDVQFTTVANCTSFSNTINGFNFTQSYDNAFIGCMSDSEADNGIQVGTSASRNIIQGCTVYNSGGHGITVGTSTICVVSGCRSHENQYAGIRLNNANDCTVTGCICWENRDAGGTGEGILVDGTSANNLIIGNRCFDDQGSKTQTYGIRELNTADYNTFIGNDVSGNGTAGMTPPVGANSKVVNNIGWVNAKVGEATMLNTAATVDVNPGFDSTIDFTARRPIIVLTGQHAEVLDVIADVKDADEFTITSQAVTTGDRKIWYQIYDASAV
jgi:parallel beta-helix repeat protein